MRSMSSQRWLDAYTEPHASLYTFGQCMTLADLSADGDHKLVVADLGTGTGGSKLKVYRGTGLLQETTLVSVPTAVVSFYMDTNEPRIPAVAVASGSDIFVYKNLRPYFKFSLPSLDVNALELDLWSHARDQDLEVSMLVETLQRLREELGFSSLSAQSQTLLSTAPAEQAAFVEKYKDTTVKRQALITCMTTLHKNSADPNAVAVLVVATETGDIFFLDPQAFTILDTLRCGDGRCSAAPSLMASRGLLDVDFRLVLACRDGSVLTARRGHVSKTVALTSQCAALVLVGADIVTATSQMELQCHSKHGKKRWCVALPGAVTALTPIPLPNLGMVLVAAALTDGAVHFYNGRDLVDVITATDTVSALMFGRYGQEENSLVMVTVGGCLMVKILKRTAVFTAHPDSGPSASAQPSLSIPRRSRLFAEQALRERAGHVDMHRSFQRDLFKLRLETARACAAALEGSSKPVSGDARLKMSAQVLGLGPMFKLHVTLENMAASEPTLNLSIVFHADVKSYALEKYLIEVPFLVPGLIYNYDTFVECKNELGISDEIRIFIVKEKETQPILAALIHMPVCDVLSQN